MYYIGLDVHKKTISYCVKDASGQVHQEGKVGATRWDSDSWMWVLTLARFGRLTGNSDTIGLWKSSRQSRNNVDFGSATITSKPPITRP
jgi:hypothetical protein